ncbi:MAG TPA: hypothetical protein VHC19_28120, partial [Pirellulales bacterium]|nr:hypothetical protein [Pirellulales bacterium]
MARASRNHTIGVGPPLVVIGLPLVQLALRLGHRVLLVLLVLGDLRALRDPVSHASPQQVVGQLGRHATLIAELLEARPPPRSAPTGLPFTIETSPGSKIGPTWFQVRSIQHNDR